MSYKDLTGLTFGRLTVIERHGQVCPRYRPPTEKGMSVMEKKSDGMTLGRIIHQLGSLKSNSEDFARNEKNEPDSVWREDIVTLEEAISILSDLQDYGCSTADEFRDWFHDVKLMQKEYQSMHRRFRTEEKPYFRDGVWHCPACDHRVMPKHSFCHWCGKKLGGW